MLYNSIIIIREGGNLIMETAKYVLDQIKEIFMYVIDMLKEIFGVKDEEAAE